MVRLAYVTTCKRRKDGPDPKPFTSNSNLKQHMKGHTREGLPECHLCTKKYVHQKDADKCIALKKVANLYDIDPSRVMCIGDAPNDVSMIQWAGKGVAVSNAWDCAKQVADAIVPSNEEAGVAYAIRKFVFGEDLD